jgi:hypothetical protein
MIKAHVWVYHGATSEDVYEANDEHEDADLELLASPQCSRVATSYATKHVEAIAKDMWADIVESYEEAYSCKLPLLSLQTTHRHKVVDSARATTVLEFAVVSYFISQSVEPVMQVIAQKRPLRN